MADFSKITSPAGGTTYDVKDATARTSIAGLTNTVDDHTTRITSLEGNPVIKSQLITGYTDSNGVFRTFLDTRLCVWLGWSFRYQSYKTTFANQKMEVGTDENGLWCVYTTVANTNLQLYIYYIEL